MPAPPVDPLRFSVIIPVYNRPEEVRELLESLTEQTDRGFEVLVVEDGSEDRCEEIVAAYEQDLDVRYFYKPNSGPGSTRNYGAERATGDYYVFFDSDCIVPPHYVATVRAALEANFADAYGGPDRAHASFTAVQKAINYAMTSFLTTGGIRGGRRQLETFKPRSFNMGIAREAFAQVQGFAPMRFGEDVDLSLRLQAAGLDTRLVSGAFVYHKRRADFRKFFKQVFNSGIARINLYRRHPGSLKPVHALPAAFTLGSGVLVVSAATGRPVLMVPLALYAAALFVDAWRQTRSLRVAVLAVAASFVQLTGYGLGFLNGVWRRLVLGKREFHAFARTFYR